jgi:hypothetical protein
VVLTVGDADRAACSNRPPLTDRPTAISSSVWDAAGMTTPIVPGEPYQQQPQQPDPPPQPVYIVQQAPTNPGARVMGNTLLVLLVLFAVFVLLPTCACMGIAVLGNVSG